MTTAREGHSRPGAQTLRTFAGINPRTYRHSVDADYFNRLDEVGGLADLVHLFSKHIHERSAAIENTASNIRVGPTQLPRLHLLFTDCCTRLGLSYKPDLYIGYGDNAWTSGVDRPYVVVGGALLGSLPESGARFVLGHELGHIMHEHVLHMQVARWSTSIAGSLPAVGKFFHSKLQSALLSWSRAAEFSADRAGLLACQDLAAAAQTLMCIGRFPNGYSEPLSLEGALEQAASLDERSEHWLSRLLGQAAQQPLDHPWPVFRVAELHRWCVSGEYEALLHQTPDLPATRPSALRDAGEAALCKVCGVAVPASDPFCSACGAPRARCTAKLPSEGERT